MGLPAARMTDMHVCPMITVLVPHVGGPIIVPCMPTVLIGGLPAARVTDSLVCVGPPDFIVKGSGTVFIGRLPAARILDMTLHGGLIVMGWPTVLIGDAGPAAGLAGPPLLIPALAMIAQSLLDGTTIPNTWGPVIQIPSTDPIFRAKTIIALNQIDATPTGHALLADLAAKGNPIIVKPTTGGNQTLFDPTKGMVQSDGTNGAGTGSTIMFNPDKTAIGTEPWETRPPAIGLAHELGHADKVGGGGVDTTQEDNDHAPDPANPGQPAQQSHEEVRNSGIPPYQDEPYNENKIREEWTDPPQPKRAWY